MMVAGAFFLRVLLETEMNWYYLWPMAALCLPLALRRGRSRFALCSLALAASVALGDHRVHDIVLWWPAFMATAVVMLLAAAPPPRRWANLARRPQPAGAVTRPVECTSMKMPLAAGGRRE
jgi:peptidoglycan/LPS O-acetylase OafA/YrhL